MEQLAGGRVPRRPDAGRLVRAANGGSAEALLAAGPAPSLETLAERSDTAPCDGGCSAILAEATEAVLPEAQARWAARPLVERLQVVRAARHLMAAKAEMLASAISAELARSRADTLATEVLPLLDGMRFLERRAAVILAPRKLGRRGRPLWLAGLQSAVQSEIQRVPLGHILVIGPANFPLFVPGAQVMQALAAGNAVTWKPGTGGERVARGVAHALREAGLPRGVLQITAESVEAAQTALGRQPDKVVFTGSLASGQAVLRTLAETATPAVMELSGTDAVVVLPSADLAVVARAVAFGLRLNGAEVCMSPRRLVATPGTLRTLKPLLEAELAKIAPVALKPRTAAALKEVVEAAQAAGAVLLGELTPEAQRPLLVANVTPDMRVAGSDLFAPVLSLMEAPSVLHMPPLVNSCQYALTAAVFGEVRQARAVGDQLRVGTVLVNDLIAPTADPRVPFAGRGRSGYGATRGAEGLLEMTATKTVLVRRRGSTLHYDPVGEREVPLFTSLIAILHGGSLRERAQAMRALVSAGRKR